MKRAFLSFPSIPCDLLDSGKNKEDTIPIIPPTTTNSNGTTITGGRNNPPIYVIGENGKNSTKVSSYPHVPPTKG